MIDATLEVLRRGDVQRLTVAQIITTARVARKTFYDIFTDVEACLLAASEQAVEQIRDQARAAFAAESEWRRGMRAALGVILSEIERDRALATVLLARGASAGPLQSHRAALLEEAAAALDTGAENGRRTPAPNTGSVLAGGIAELVHQRLLEGDRTPLDGLLKPIMSMIVLSYYGTRAAARELVLPAPVIAPSSSVPAARRSTKKLEDLGVRVTYRTIRVLSAIADEPGSSNREIADTAGISDAGQISKLLKRLHGLQLVENDGVGAAAGGSNRWCLTERGAELQAVLGADRRNVAGIPSARARSARRRERDKS